MNGYLLVVKHRVTALLKLRVFLSHPQSPSSLASFSLFRGCHHLFVNCPSALFTPALIPHVLGRLKLPSLIRPIFTLSTLPAWSHLFLIRTPPSMPMRPIFFPISFLINTKMALESPSCSSTNQT